MMDGYEELVKSDEWKQLMIAQEAVQKLQQILEANSYDVQNVYISKCKLVEVGNAMRVRYRYGMEGVKRNANVRNTNII